MDVKALLSAHPAWLAHLETLGGIDLALPDDLPSELLRLAVPHEDVNAVLAARPEPGSPQWWLAERCAHSLVSTMGDLDDPPPFQPLPELGPYFYVYVFLAALPHTRRYHRELGIPEEVSWATFADLGRNMAVHRKRHGTGGLHAPHWFMLHARGILYALGRLQFNRGTAGSRTAAAIEEAGVPVGPRRLALEVHVPDLYGPLTPEACDASFDRARRFFPRHFPQEDYQVMTCGSWLLDEQLARHLPAESNILAFQRRFHPLHRFDNAETVPFVFGVDAADPARLPRRTRLERAVADHLASGGTWYGRIGWLRF
ncbi:acyltransferase domain-containing protein [Nonomuraea diastatica]|uniref:acyltransferase domain-containing protein n=1 Tax=Nonomuraea diastatica TaxID=1848329 RepID=UPI00140A96E6|nr:acyltransferase domain-containing protein [Nonomuraea diastatica]